MNLRNLNDKILLESTKKLSAEERKITADILNHLREIEFRRLHLELGYSSLFEYCLRELKYSESQAYRRVSAMRLIRDLPEIENKIKDGSLTLSNAAKIQTFIKQTKAQNKVITKIEKQDLIKKIENKSARECDLELLKLSPEPIIIKTKERVISEEYTEYKITIKKDLKSKLDKVKSLLSHQNPNGDLNKLLDILCDMVLKKKDTSSRRKASITSQVQSVATQSSPKSVPIKNQSALGNKPSHPVKPLSKNSRYIPSTARHEVYMRDKGCCTYTDPKTHRKCESRHLLQYDHKYPLSLGGETDIKNLRLLCFQHHKYITENIKGCGL